MAVEVAADEGVAGDHQVMVRDRGEEFGAVGSGEGKLPGSALWLRAEPGEDAAMAEAMAADIHDWAMTCVAG